MIYDITTIRLLPVYCDALLTSYMQSYLATACRLREEHIPGWSGKLTASGDIQCIPGRSTYVAVLPTSNGGGLDVELVL